VYIHEHSQRGVSSGSSDKLAFLSDLLWEYLQSFSLSRLGDLSLSRLGDFSHIGLSEKKKGLSFSLSRLADLRIARLGDLSL